MIFIEQPPNQMINFFRKTRKKLADDNKFLKYSRYAIGEILLVVIGILIALSINNWNEGKKINVTRQVYYNQLLQDFEKDKIYIEKVIVSFDSNMIKLKTYREFFKEPNLQPVQILQNLRDLDWSTRSIRFQSNTIATLQNTGDIKLIPLIIRNKLIDYKKEQELTIEYATINNSMSHRMFSFASRNFGSIELIQSIANQPKILGFILEENHNLEIIMGLESALFFKKFSESGTNSDLKKMLLDIDVIAKLINEELDNN